MKIFNTICSGCNQLLDLIYHHRGEFGEINEAFCYHCKKDYPLKACKMCKKATIHVGFSYGACTECIINKGFNLEQEYNKALKLLLMTIGAATKFPLVMPEVVGEMLVYLATIERLGYDKKYYTDDHNPNLPDSNQGITP
jgi:hypothetical protein